MIHNATAEQNTSYRYQACKKSPWMVTISTQPHSTIKLIILITLQIIITWLKIATNQVINSDIYLAKHIHGTLPSTFGQKLDPKLLDPTLSILLSIRLRYCPHNLPWTGTGTRPQWIVLSRRNTNRSPIIIEPGPGRWLWRCPSRAIRLHLPSFICINTISIPIITTATDIISALRSLSI